MIIYEAEVEGNDYYNPVRSVGIFADIGHAISEVEKASDYLEILRVTTMELKGKRFEAIEVHEFNKALDSPEWETVKQV